MSKRTWIRSSLLMLTVVTVGIVPRFTLIAQAKADNAKVVDQRSRGTISFSNYKITSQDDKASDGDQRQESRKNSLRTIKNDHRNKVKLINSALNDPETMLTRDKGTNHGVIVDSNDELPIEVQDMTTKLGKNGK